MPLISGRHDGRSAIVPVAIIDAASYAQHKRLEHPYLANSARFDALIDTGATTTMISSRVVQTLGLRPINRLAYRGLGGSTWRAGYLFHLAFFDGVVHLDDPVADRSNAMNRLRVGTKVINGGELTEVSFDVLIGMDMISTGTLTISLDGTFSFAF